MADLGRGLVQQAGIVKAVSRAATGNGLLPVTVLHTEWAE